MEWTDYQQDLLISSIPIFLISTGDRGNQYKQM